MKILHLLSSDKFSGAENVVCQIIDIFQNELDFDMIYCSPYGEIEKILNDKSVKRIFLKKLSIFELYRVINIVKPDIIHAHDVKASILASFFYRNIKIISHIHVSNNNMQKINFKTLLYLSRSSKFNHIFWVSESALNCFKFKNKVNNISSVLVNVVDYNRILEMSLLDKNIYDYDIVYIGRLVEQKNPIRLIEILEKVIMFNHTLKVAIIGTGNLLEEVKYRVVSKKLESNIHFLGFQNNPFGILKYSKVIVMTSLFEGTPMSALEAMAIGIPLVSTPTDGLLYLVDDGITGFLSNDDNEFAKRIIEIISDDELQNKLSSETKKKFSKINDVNKYKLDLENVYNE